MLDISLSREKSDNPCKFASGFVTKKILFFSLPDIILNFVYSPIVFRDGIRKKENFLSADLLCLDFDKSDTPLIWALEFFSNFLHIIATTRSHQIKKNGITCDRYRVIIPFKNEIHSLGDYECVLSNITRLVNADIVAKDGARFFFPSKKIVSFNFREDGFKFDHNKFLQKIALKDFKSIKEPVPRPPQNLYLVAKTNARLFRYLLRTFVQKGERNKHIYKLAKEAKVLGLTINEAFKEISKANIENLNDMIKKGEVMMTIRSAYK